MKANMLQRFACLAALAAGLFLSGCGQPDSPRFALNLEGPDKAETSREAQQKIVDAMTALFGQPDEPFVFPEAGLDLKKIQLAAGPSWSDEEGTRHGLFRVHCAHCHGVTGDGYGPTARFLNPYPRDYRKGIFKFTSTEDGAKPTAADLKRTIVDGIHGTAMPSFSLLPEDEIDALVEYVKYLAIRGETEELVYAMVTGGDEPTRENLVADCLEPIANMWKEAETKIVVPAERSSPVDTPEKLAASIEAGRKLFQDQKRAQCTKCHGPTGLGDGGDVLYDVWNDAKKGRTPAEVAQFWTLPIQELKPRNLRLGIYRGGRRPMDLYRRINSGIKGANMPAAGPKPGTPAVLNPEEIWSLVDYVRSMPYETSTPKAQEHTTAHLSTN
jgi:mono/diheme cytochrome c family protein